MLRKKEAEPYRSLFVLIMYISSLIVYSYLAIAREGEDNELFITLVPKVYNNDFLFVGLTTLGTF